MAITHPSFGTLADDRIIIFDTTLRDGEQSPGFSMNLEEKLRMAEALHELGADVLEAGFAIASPGDFESVQSIARRFAKDGPVVASLSRANTADIMASAEATAKAIDRQLAGQAMPQAATIAELAAVYGRYRSHLHATYAGPRRFWANPFWARRIAALAS